MCSKEQICSGDEYMKYNIKNNKTNSTKELLNKTVKYGLFCYKLLMITFNEENYFAFQ